MDIDQLAGSTLGSYEIERLLGRGGMGVVYKARQISLDRPVALKILSPTLSSDPSFVKRFQREARAMAKYKDGRYASISEFLEEDRRLRRPVYFGGKKRRNIPALHSRPSFHGYERRLRIFGPAEENRLGQMIGKTISHYRILEKLGEGGARIYALMGQGE